HQQAVTGPGNTGGSGDKGGGGERTRRHPPLPRPFSPPFSPPSLRPCVPRPRDGISMPGYDAAGSPPHSSGRKEQRCCFSPPHPLPHTYTHAPLPQSPSIISHNPPTLLLGILIVPIQVSAEWRFG
ncbi:hypothetical protein Vretimale_3342, partial [Volvox reticuliferus]